MSRFTYYFSIIIQMNAVVAALIKYITEGLVVAVVAYYIPRQKLSQKELIGIAVTAAATFGLLDTFSPQMGSGARMGAGLAMGARAAAVVI
jgi:hypothetical protein